MKAQIRLVSNDNTEIINVENIENINCFKYIDSYNAVNDLTIYDDGLKIKRTSDSHNTEIVLRMKKKSFVFISSDEGKMIFDAKILAFERNNDIITLVYNINNERKSIEIKYIGVSLCQQNQ